MHQIMFLPWRGIKRSATGENWSVHEHPFQLTTIRLAFAVLRLDAYLSAMTDFPPLIRYQELSMPLSQATYWENVVSEEERCKLLEAEPLMRKKTSLSFRVHDLFGAPRSNALASPWTKMDYQYALSSPLSPFWHCCYSHMLPKSSEYIPERVIFNI